MKYRNISVLIGGLVIMTFAFVSITKLIAQEIPPTDASLPSNTEKIPVLKGEQDVRTRQQNMRTEQLQRQSPSRSPDMFPAGENVRGTENVENREQRMTERCNIIASNVEKHQERFITKSETRIALYNKVITRLESISNSLRESGVDTSLLDTYIGDLKSKVVVLDSSSTTYSSSLKTNGSELCAQKDIKSIIDTRKQELQAIIAQDKAVRQTLRETVVPYLKTLRPGNEPNQSGVQDSTRTESTAPVPTSNQ